MASRSRAPLLKLNHFGEHSCTRMDEQGLQFDQLIDDETRQFEGGRFDTWKQQEKAFAKLAKRRPTRVVVNPSSPTASELIALLRQAQTSSKGRMRFDIEYGCPDPYDRKWVADHSTEVITEGQSIVAVAFDGSDPVGYAGLSIFLNHMVGERDYTLRVEASLVYVAPQRRRQGYGLDLSMACGILAREVFAACIERCPPAARSSRASTPTITPKAAKPSSCT